MQVYFKQESWNLTYLYKKMDVLSNKWYYEIQNDLDKEIN